MKLELTDNNKDMKNLIKGLIASDGITMEELNNKINEKYGRNKSLQNLSAKLSRNSLRADELLEILLVLGYTIEINK
ncbi:DUF6471 domain-containing protein [Clostridium sp. UBA1652]|uniref:DUF6471 domain-containing protein n=1 Tax=Clostridium sp. UBA1652 TaxID=1946348 RepID=UPI0025806AC1|nr:DUF6471 domain-containing protein [Clostridium sp. UBA1652]